jgi:hypothetical protein
MHNLPSSARAAVLSVAAVVAAAATAVGCEHKAAEPIVIGDAAPHTGALAASASDAAPTIHVDNSGAAVPLASVEAVVNPQKLPAYQGPTGSVEGTVFVRGPDSPDVPDQDFRSCPAALDTYGKLFRAGPPRGDGLRPLADAVVVVTGYKGFFLPEQNEAQVVTITANCGYPTRTIAITFGQRLDIANESRVAFAPTLSGVYQPAVMLAPPFRAGEPVKLYPPRPGHYVIGDQMQPFVREALLVLLQPLHDVSNTAGHFRIDGVPVGKLKIGTQLDALGPAIPAVDIDVRPNVVEHVELVIPYEPTDAGAVKYHKVIP